MNKEQFVSCCRNIGIEIDDDKLNLLDKFYNLLISWNEKINLTTIVEKQDVYLKHFYDSLTLYDVKKLDSSNYKLCDVGSGAGCPGIVLKIVFPNLDIVLVDSLMKRVNYLNEVIKDLNLSNIVAIHGRMEEFSRVHEEEFDIITARAVGSISYLSEICSRALKVNGELILMRGEVMDDECNLDNMMKCLSLDLSCINKFNLPFENSKRSLVVFKKLASTQLKYPRDNAKMKKNPL